MKKLQDKTNVLTPDGTYDLSRMIDDTGSADGTPLDVELHNDSMLFFEKLMAESGVVANGLPDNAVNGYQLYEAFRKLTKPYKAYDFTILQSGTSAPTVTVMGFNEIGTIVWTRTTTGVYLGTLASAFPSNLTWLTSSFRANLGFGYMARTSGNTVEIRTFSSAGSAADSILTSIPLEIRAYDY